MSLQTQAGIDAEINTNLPSNDTGAVTAAALRQVLHDMNASTFALASSQGLVNSVFRYGAAGDGTTDDARAFNAALAANGYAIAPPASYAIQSAAVTIPAGGTLETYPGAGLTYSGAGTLLISPGGAFITKEYGDQHDGWLWARATSGTRSSTEDPLGMLGRTATFNYAFVNTADNGQTLGIVNNLVSFQQFGGAAVTGAREALLGYVFQTAATSTSNTFRDYVGGVFISETSSGDGGTLGAEQGAYFGGNSQSRLNAGAAHIFNATAHEFDVYNAAGCSLKLNWGINIVSFNAVQGSSNDAAIAIYSGNLSQSNGNSYGPGVGFHNGLCFAEIAASGRPPVDAGATLIGTHLETLSSFAAANGIDLRNFTFSNYAFASPGFYVDGAGNIVALGASHIAVGTAMPFTVTGYSTATINGPSGAALSLQVGPAEYLRHMTNGSIAYALTNNIPYVIGTIFGVNWAEFSASALNVLPTTAATSTTTGALQVAGGAGIAGALYNGGNASLGGGQLDYNLTTPGVWTFASNVTINAGLSANVLTLTKNALAGNAPANSGDGLILQNLTPATSGTQQNSPNIHLAGQGWKTSGGGASQQVDWLITNQPAQGTSAPSTTLIFSSQINGGGYTSNFTLSPVNGLFLTGQTAAQPTPPPGSWLTIVGANGAAALANLYAYGANAGVNYARANGSLGSETLLNNNDILGQFTWRGWNGSAYTGSQALVDVLASGNWVNGSNYGAHLRFATTAQNSTTVGIAMSVWGGVIIGSGTTDPGAGNLAFGAAFGIYSGSTLVADYNTTNAGAWTFAAGIDLSSGGLLVGAATGGNPGAGKVNVSAGIYLNNSAYTNPDYVFERHFTGKIEQFADRPGARRYPGRLPLDALERHVAEHFRFPGISEEPTDIFERGDIALEKLEEQALYLFELNAHVGRLESGAAERR
jgi:fibronectin-binding autotransporter adhesin